MVLKKTQKKKPKRGGNDDEEDKIKLSLFDCDFHNFKVLCITSPSLKHLSIRNCRLLHQTLKVFAPNLLTLTYAADLPADFVLDSFQSLVEADVQIFNDLDQARIYGPSIKLYQKLSNVKLLKTSGSSFRGVRSNDLQDDDWTINSLPQYSMPNLKVVLIRNFIGRKVELDVVKFFLANAEVLQTLTIMISIHLSKDYKKQTQIASELLKFPRYSASCALQFMTPE
ncbi:hypothetical protein C5167_047837 [Papaver somniferum]|uniref:FBD domain-containing protein n=1 Tax=Papaver somniferum TaxID=3469 RepID=A0A4Y7LHT1_PAPSO|nr:hypothetical protein C5167_047837 [Papaver somniferum]